MSKVAVPAVMLAPFAAGAQDMWQTVGALGAGLIAVWVSRRIFVDRENKRLRREQTFRETAPVTAMAMLLTAVWIIDHRPSLSSAVIAGLGVGWVAVLILDMIGARVVAMLKAGLAVRSDGMDIPPDQRVLVDKLDEIDPTDNSPKL